MTERTAARDGEQMPLTLGPRDVEDVSLGEAARTQEDGCRDLDRIVVGEIADRIPRRIVDWGEPARELSAGSRRRTIQRGARSARRRGW
jgi:hypothetical protein